MQQSIMEVPSPSIAVEPFPDDYDNTISRSCHQSHSGPAFGTGLGIFHPASSGEYPCCNTPFVPDETPTSSAQSATTTTTKLPTSIYYQNVRGLRTKLDQLRLTLSSSDYDILVFTETWLRPDIGDSEISSEYAFFRCDRSISTSQRSRGGGVLVAIKNHFQCELVSLPDCEQIEQIVVRLKLQNRWLYILAIYLPPNSSQDLYSTHSLAVQHLVGSTSDSDIVLSLGDYNLPNLRWQFDDDIHGYLPSNASSEHELTVVETMFATGLQQINGYVNTNSRLLDLAFVNLPEHFDAIKPPVPLLPVDMHHVPFVVLLDSNFDTSVVLDEQSTRLSFNFQHCDFDLLNDALSSVSWEFQNDSSVDDVLSIFYDKLNDVIQTYVPRRRSASNSFYKKP